MRLATLLILLLWPVLAAASGCGLGAAGPEGGEGPVGLDVGMTAPGFKLPRLDQDGDLALHDLRGQVVVMSFWASWCGPCRLEIPALETLHARARADGLAVVGVSLDHRREDAVMFLSSLPSQVTYPMLLDAGNDVGDRYGISNIPMLLVLDRKGRIRSRHLGFRPGSLEGVEAEVRRLLAEPAGGA